MIQKTPRTNCIEAALAGDLDYAPKREGFEPTQARCGTREKVEVLAQRVLDGFPLWHEADGVMDDVDKD